MLESSPGYALFTDLRKKMGTSSSQPVQTPSRVATASMVASPAAERKAHFNPKMDDVAASQQLIDEEGTRAAATAAADGMNGEDMTLSQVDGSHDASSSVRKKRKRRSAHKSSQNSIAISPAATQDILAQSEDPASSPFPFPASQPEAELPAVNGFKPSTAIEVPDSQVPAQSLHTSASSPMSNHVIPSSATKSKRTYKKSKRTKRDRLSRDTMQEEDYYDRDISMLLEEALSPSHTPSKYKPSQVDNATLGSHSEAVVVPVLEDVRLRKAATEAVATTPTPAKRRKIGSVKSATRIRDLIQDGPHDGNDEDDDLSRSHEKTKLKRIKKPQTPVAKSKNIYEIPDDDLRPTNGHGENGQGNGDAEHTQNLDTGDVREVNTPKQTSTRKPRGSLHKAKKTMDEAHDSATPVRTPGHPLGEGDYEDSIMREPVSSDEDNDRGPPPNDDDNSESEKKQKKKKKKQSSTKNATPRRESGKFIYRRKKIQTDTAAERALKVDHDLNHPPDLRKTGDFTLDEEELIRRAVRDFQDRKELEVPQLVRIIQWSKKDPALNRANGDVSGKNDWTPQDVDNARESAEFWNDIRNIATKRSFDRMRRHIRQTYHAFKSGAWTDEEDQLLRDLYAQHPNKWKVIEIGMGDRSMHDCQNRWRDYLQYGDKLKSSRWEPEEEELFIRAITTVAQRDEDYRAEQGSPPVDEYTIKHINWQQVSREMDNTRSRIQVVAKWKNLQKRDPPPRIRVEHKPRQNKPATAGLTASDPTPRKRGRPRQGEGETPKGRHDGKPQNVIDNPDGDEGYTAPPSKKRGRPSLGESSVVNKSKKFRTTEQDAIVDNSDEEGHAKQVTNGSPAKKKRRKSQKSEGMEGEKPKKSRKGKTRDEIEDPDDEVDANQKATSSPPPKKRGRPRKTDDMESEEPKRRRKLKVAAKESVEDLELQEGEQVEHAESVDELMEDVRPDPVGEVNSDQPQEDSTDVAQKENKGPSAGPSSSVRPNNLPNQQLDDGHEEPQDMAEDEDPIEDEEDQPSVAPESPAKNVHDEQSEADSGGAVSQEDNDEVLDKENDQANVTPNSPATDFLDDRQSDANSDATSQKDNEELDEEDNQISVKHNGPAEVIDDDQSEADSDTTSQKQGEEVLDKKEDQLSVAPNSLAANSNDSQSETNSDAAPQKQYDPLPGEEEPQSSATIMKLGASKQIISDAARMQWGDLYDLIAKLQEGRDEEEGDIDWEGIAEEMATDRNYIWSQEALKTAFEDLIQLIKDNGKEVDTEDLPGTVDDIMDFISTEHGTEIEEYYMPE